MERRRLLLTLVACSALASGFSFSGGHAETHSAMPRGQIVSPSSSIAHPEDAGVRVHTTVKLFVPAGGRATITPPSPLHGVTPEELPPFPGLYSWNTPASLACVYRLVRVQDDSCNPYVVTRIPSAGSRAIAVVDAFDAPNAASDLAAFSAQFGLYRATCTRFTRPPEVAHRAARNLPMIPAGRSKRHSISNGLTRWHPAPGSISSRRLRTASPICSPR
jgi:hypothetical protein